MGESTGRKQTEAMIDVKEKPKGSSPRFEKKTGVAQVEEKLQ